MRLHHHASVVDVVVLRLKSVDDDKEVLSSRTCAHVSAAVVSVGRLS